MTMSLAVIRGNTDGATGDPSYDSNSDLWDSDDDSGTLMEQPGTRVMIRPVLTDADLYPPSRQNQQVGTPSNPNCIIGAPIGLAELLRMRPHLCQHFSRSTLEAVMGDPNPNPAPAQPDSVIWF